MPDSQRIDEAWRVFAADDLHAAIALAQQAHSAVVTTERASAALGYFLIQANALEQAANVLLPARARAPHYAPLHWYTGYLFERQGEMAAAAQAFEQACTLDSSLDEAAFALGWTLNALGRKEEALVWAAHALAFARSPQRLQQNAWLQQQLGHAASAKALWGEAIAAYPANASEQPLLHLHLAQCLARLGEVDAANTALDHARKQWPKHTELAVGAVWLLHANGNIAGAADLARELTLNYPAHAPYWHVLGAMQQEAGDLEAADQSLAQAQERDLGLVDVLVRRAAIQRGWKRYEGARWLLGLALERTPSDPVAQDLLIQVLLDLDEDLPARRMLVKRLRARTHPADLWRLLAVTQLRRGRPKSAIRALSRLLANEPDNIEALRMRAWLAHAQNDPVTAVSVVRHLLDKAPHDPSAQAQAAQLFLSAGNIGDAQLWAERAVARAPDLYESWRALSAVRFMQQRLADAQAAIEHALRLSPQQSDCLRQLGSVFLAAGQYGQAQLAYLSVIESKPQDPVPRLELAQVQARAGHFADALAGVSALLAKTPDWRPALLARAQLLTEGGLDGSLPACTQLLRNDRFAPDTAKALLRLVALGDGDARLLLQLVPADVLRAERRQSIEKAVHSHALSSTVRLTQLNEDVLDDDPWTATAALYAASLTASSDATGLARQARDWFRNLKIHSGLSKLPHGLQAAAHSDDRPRIAYIVRQLHQSLLVRVLNAHNADRAIVFVYTNHPISGLPAHVRVQPLSSETLAESCAANGIDVTIDTGGLHPFEGQFELLHAYARRLAPVQIGWLGCGCTAGGLFDALLADEVSIPPSHAVHYAETVLRLAGGQWCWEPSTAAPPVVPLPLLDRGAVTFGVTSRSIKLDASCLDRFAQIVASTPQASIRFIGEISTDWPLRRDVLARMQAHGVDCGRVFFDPFMQHTAYLTWLTQIDLVLDSFPGNGGLSLLDPLWMGVPVVTLAGGWAAARQGAAVLHALGLEQWVADSQEMFCAKAVALAGNADVLAAHRRTLRARIMGSPLVDGQRVAHQIESFCAQLREQSVAIASQSDSKDRTRIHAQWELDAWLGCPRTIEVPAVHANIAPELSVIVVLFNQAGLSRRALQALADQECTRYETIIVDNASTDRTCELLACLRGAHVIRNTGNLGFLQAARQGAAVARGRYLAFLNNDALLQKGALEAAINAMDADSSIGALGGRIVLTDGGLQEAGNFVFDSGAAGGIGRGEDAFGHASRAARATDYVSGVFLVTPTCLWRKLDGFDPVFAPAYYEDTDYCMRVWQAGYRVVCEPTVTLEHLEWGSAKGSSATQLMERNRVIFKNRHADFLRSQPKPQVLSLDGDRWRAPSDRPRLPRVLFLDNEVPHMFKGGGLPRARHMLQALRGWPVTLLPLWTVADHWHAIQKSLPNTVEVALGYGLDGLEAFLERRRGIYDVMLVSRPPNMQAIAPLRARRPELFDGMRLVYDAEALFTLREIAQAGVRRKPMTRERAQSRMDTELGLAHGASDVLVVSQRDARYFMGAGKRTHLLSHSIATRRDAPGLATRSGLLFVGAIHPDTPNEDGLLWFINEVMPLLRLRMAAPPILSVVGVCLSERVAALASTDVKILGPQPVLEPHYDAARVFVAPVRFAGGVPAKVIEAAAAGIPVVASTLLVRQLDWRDGLDIVGARDARAFAYATQQLLEDNRAWQRQQQAALEQCAQRYDPELFGASLRRILVNLSQQSADVQPRR